MDKRCLTKFILEVLLEYSKSPLLRTLGLAQEDKTSIGDMESARTLRSKTSKNILKSIVKYMESQCKVALLVLFLSKVLVKYRGCLMSKQSNVTDNMTHQIYKQLLSSHLMLIHLIFSHVQKSADKQPYIHMVIHQGEMEIVESTPDC